MLRAFQTTLFWKYREEKTKHEDVVSVAHQSLQHNTEEVIQIIRILFFATYLNVSWAQHNASVFEQMSIQKESFLWEFILAVY